MIYRQRPKSSDESNLFQVIRSLLVENVVYGANLFALKHKYVVRAFRRKQLRDCWFLDKSFADRMSELIRRLKFKRQKSVFIIRKVN